MVSDSNLERLLLEARYPDAEVDNIGQMQGIVMDDPLRVALQFTNADGTNAVRLFLPPAQFFQMFEMFVTLARDLAIPHSGPGTTSVADEGDGPDHSAR